MPKLGESQIRMSKKKFTAGLESLFGDQPTDVDQKGNFLLFPVDKELEEKRKDFEKGASNKNFATDIDSFLKEAFEEAFEEVQESSKTQKSSSKKTNKPLSGLDALIRSTIEPGPIEFEQGKAKRVSFVFDREKLEKLKEIAKVEKSYLKDIIRSVVEEYIDNYEKKKGKLN